MVSADRSIFMTVLKLGSVMMAQAESRSLCRTPTTVLTISDLAKSATLFVSRRTNISEWV